MSGVNPRIVSILMIFQAIVDFQVWNKMLVMPRTDRGAKREDHLATMEDQWPLRQEHDTVGKVT